MRGFAVVSHGLRHDDSTVTARFLDAERLIFARDTVRACPWTMVGRRSGSHVDRTGEIGN